MQHTFSFYQKFCEFSKCLEPVGEFPYTTKDGHIYCSPECAFLAEEDIEIGDVSCADMV